MRRTGGFIRRRSRDTRDESAYGERWLAARTSDIRGGSFALELGTRQPVRWPLERSSEVRPRSEGTHDEPGSANAWSSRRSRETGHRPGAVGGRLGARFSRAAPSRRAAGRGLNAARPKPVLLLGSAAPSGRRSSRPIGTGCRRRRFRSSGGRVGEERRRWRRCRSPVELLLPLGGRGSGGQADRTRIARSPSTTGLLDSPERRARPARTFGGVAEWLGKGLQNPVHRFNSGPRLRPSGPSSSIEGRTRALSSGVERFLDAEEVRGSNPLAPTTDPQIRGATSLRPSRFPGQDDGSTSAGLHPAAVRSIHPRR
jgi:hypothetical protein